MKFIGIRRLDKKTGREPHNAEPPVITMFGKSDDFSEKTLSNV